MDRFSKNTHSKFNENLSSGSQVPCGWTDGQENMKKVTIAFRSFVNAPKNSVVKVGVCPKSA